MPRVRLEVDVSPELMHRYEEEARREGDTAEHLLEQTVKVLLRDMEDDEEQPPDPAAGMS